MDKGDFPQTREELLEKLKKLIGKKVKIYIDRPIGSVHPKHSDIVYKVNYGYIREYIALDGEYQDAYLLGIEAEVQSCEGVVYAIINRKDDNEDKLIMVANEKEYTNKEIEELVSFQEKYFKHKIIR